MTDGLTSWSNNAGGAQTKSLMKWTEEEWRQVLAVNLGSVWFLSRAAAGPMLEQGKGAIVNMGEFGAPERSELLHSATIAIVGEAPLDRLWHAVPSYPTVSEVWLGWLEGRRPPDRLRRLSPGRGGSTRTRPRARA